MRDENSFFKNALQNFTKDVACGGAIRHLTDLGFSAQEIRERLDFPMDLQEIEEVRRQRLVDTGALPSEEGSEKKDYDIVKEQTKYGKTTFRKVPKTSPKDPFENR